MELRVRHTSGLGYIAGSYVTINRSGQSLVFSGVMEKGSVAGFKGVNEEKKEKIEVEKRIQIADIESVKLVPAAESSSDYGTVVKTFIVLTIKDPAGFTYEVFLAGDEIKRVTPAYNDFIDILTQGL